MKKVQFWLTIASIVVAALITILAVMESYKLWAICGALALTYNLYSLRKIRRK